MVNRNVAPFGTGTDDIEKYPLILRFVYIFGIPAALSVYLIWMLASRVDVQQRTAIDELHAIRVDLQFMIKANTEQLERLQQTYRLMQRICVNAATTADERASCFSLDVRP